MKIKLKADQDKIVKLQAFNLSFFLVNLFLVMLNFKIVIQFNDTSLVAEQSNYQTKNVNGYIVFDLDNWPHIPTKILFVWCNE